MAIKGKNRSKSRGRGAPAPKPRVEPRKQPLTKRPGFRKGAIVVGALLALWIASIVWGNVSRSSALRTYDKKLFEATRPFLKHAEPSEGGTLYVNDVHRKFQQGEITVQALRDAIKAWEADFAAARDAVRALDPPTADGVTPDELLEANALIGEGIEGYRGVARLYEIAAQQKELIAKTKGAAARKPLEDQLQLTLVQIEELRTRSKGAYDLGRTAIERLKVAWGIGSSQAAGG